MLHSLPLQYFVILHSTYRMIFKIPKLGLTHYSDSILNTIQISVSLCCHLNHDFCSYITVYVVSMLKIFLKMLTSPDLIFYSSYQKISIPKKTFSLVFASYQDLVINKCPQSHSSKNFANIIMKCFPFYYFFLHIHNIFFSLFCI